MIVPVDQATFDVGRLAPGPAAQITVEDGLSLKVVAEADAAATIHRLRGDLTFDEPRHLPLLILLLRC